MNGEVESQRPEHRITWGFTIESPLSHQNGGAAGVSMISTGTGRKTVRHHDRRTTGGESSAIRPRRRWPTCRESQGKCSTTVTLELSRAQSAGIVILEEENGRKALR